MKKFLDKALKFAPHLYYWGKIKSYSKNHFYN